MAASNVALSPGAIPEPAPVLQPQETWVPNLNMHMVCPECKEFPPNLVEEFSSGDVVCESCGLVLGDRIVDTRSEWRTFSNDDQGNDDPSRVGDGANPLLNGSQLQTTISFVDGNASSRNLNRAQNKSTHDKSTKGLLDAYKDIGTLCDAMHLPRTVSDTVKHLFKMVMDAGTFRGKPQENIIAGCLVIGCRQCKVPRTFKEIFALTKVSKAEIGRIFKALEKFFAAQNKKKMDSVVQAGGVVNSEDNYTTTKTTRAEELCIRFCSQLGLNHRCTMLSQDLTTKLDGIGSLDGRSPLSVAAACIYMASHLLGQPKSAKDISAIAGVGSTTIRNAYKVIYPDREKLVDPKWLQDGNSNMSKVPRP